MAYHSFEKLEVWQRACRLAVEVFRAFEKCRNHALRDQVQRAALSVPSNISEGAERGTKKEFAHFITIARGSCAELRTQLYISRKLEYLATDLAKTLIEEAISVSAQLGALRRSLTPSSQPEAKPAPKPLVRHQRGPRPSNLKP